MGATLETDWFDEFESGVSLLLWPLQSTDINAAEQLCEVISQIHLLPADVFFPLLAQTSKINQSSQVSPNYTPIS